MQPSKIVLAVMSFCFVLTSCGPRAFIKGDYDENVESTNLLNDQWSETDMQKAVKDLVASALAHNAIANAKKPPIVMVTRLENKTSEHIDTQSITDMITVELTNSGKVQFVDKAARGDVAEEYDYQDSGMVSRDTKKQRQPGWCRSYLNAELIRLCKRLVKTKQFITRSI